jgi:hypothetical protein
MRAVLFSRLLAVAVLVFRLPLGTLHGGCAEVHEIPRFVLERVELPDGASDDCPQSDGRRPSCPALGAPGAGAEHAGAANACLPGE